jgi:hypothetical protein
MQTYFTSDTTKILSISRDLYLEASVLILAWVTVHSIEFPVLLEYSATPLGDWSPTFRDSSVFLSNVCLRWAFDPEDGSNNSHSVMAQFITRIKNSTASPRKSKKSHGFSVVGSH